MYLLDTNIVSLADHRRQAQYPELARWIGRNSSRLFLSVVTLMEMEAGYLKLRREKKVARAREIALLLGQIQSDYGSRVIPVDSLVALTAAHLAEEARPHVIEATDLIIAATAKRHGLTLLTANEKHFNLLSIEMISPLKTLPED